MIFRKHSFFASKFIYWDTECFYFNKRSIHILKQSGLEVAFRTTVIPGLVEEAQVESIRESLGAVRRYIIQAFRNGQNLNPQFEGIAHFDQGRIDEMRRRFEVPARVSVMPDQYIYAG